MYSPTLCLTVHFVFTKRMPYFISPLKKNHYSPNPNSPLTLTLTPPPPSIVTIKLEFDAKVLFMDVARLADISDEAIDNEQYRKMPLISRVLIQLRKGVLAGKQKIS